MQKFRLFLFPLVPVYRLVVVLRNLFFDVGLLESKSFPLPIIGVGNLIAGGSGKTPLVEYLIKLTGNGVNTATLSRGYKRRSKGFKIATAECTAIDIGDEPMQYFSKFGNLTVAVNENRQIGIKNLISQKPELELIILDDVFQHRFVKPGLNILVTDYFHPYTRDYLLPAGMLREPISGAKRANIIVVTKTPAIFSPIVRKQMLQELNPLPGQKICFAYIKYGSPVAFLNNKCSVNLENNYFILMVTGIGNPDPFAEYLKRKCTELEEMRFPDHHDFTEFDLKSIRERFLTLPTRRKIIVTTEKDAMRLKSDMAIQYLSSLNICYIPIEFEFHAQDKQIFDNTIQKFISN